MALLLVILAAIPGLLLVFYFYRRDIYEPEPTGDVAIAVLAGFLAALLAIAGSFLAGIGGFVKEPPSDLLVLAGVAARVGLVEEGAKLLVVLAIFYRRPQFNEPMDGIVYTAAVSLGFAILENIGYVLAGGAGLGLVRAFTAVPMHAFMSGIMGYFVGRAKFSKAGWAFILPGWLLAASIHAGYDFSVMALHAEPLAILGVALFFVVASWLVLKGLMARSLAGSPFLAMRDNFRVKANLGGGVYRLECQTCGTQFEVRLAGRVVCMNDTCMNYYDWPS